MLAAVLSAVMTVTPLAPPAVPDATPLIDPSVAAEAVAMFKDLCVDRFPDVALFENGIATRQGAAVADRDVKNYLHGDAGRAWRITTPLGLYVVTVEDPPYRGCGIRRMTPAGINRADLFSAVVDADAAKNHLTRGQTMNMHQTPSPGVDVSAFAMPLTDENKRIVENFMVFLTNYHGRPPVEFRPDAKGTIGVEIRFVRQLPSAAVKLPN